MKEVFAILLIMLLIFVLYCTFNFIAFIIFIRIYSPPSFCNELWDYLIFRDVFDIYENERYILLIVFVIFPWFIYRYMIAVCKQRKRDIVDRFINELTE